MCGIAYNFLPCPESDLSEAGPAESPPDPFLCCLKVEEIVGLEEKQFESYKSVVNQF